MADRILVYRGSGNVPGHERHVLRIYASVLKDIPILLSSFFFFFFFLLSVKFEI
jgi:ABC-type amino acid transport system permease subunit